jgi:GTP cyclohydrolase I
MIVNTDQSYYEQRDEDLYNAATAFSEVLTLIVPDYNADDIHMMETPERFVKMLRDLTEPERFNFTTFDSNVDEMVVVSDIPFYTFCAHHVLPFHGVAHVAYLPQGKLCGISKLARTVQHYSKGLNVQEELTTKIADFIEDKLNPIGVGVVMKAEHLCMTMRGAQVAGAITTTSAMRGAFLNPEKQARAEFLSIIGGK